MSSKTERECPGYNREPHMALMTHDQKYCTNCKIPYQKDQDKKRRPKKYTKAKYQPKVYTKDDYAGFVR